ncbi:MAG: MliC family protein [Paracoccaceae bacterium]|nr:MliC family protein [Paracoccaceae bacterium]
MGQFQIMAGFMIWTGAAMTANAGSVAALYLCERSVELPVVFVEGKDSIGVAVLLVEGEMIHLETTPSASGARYAGPRNLSGYVWWTKGDAAMLTWFDATTGQETPVYAQCTQSDG